MSYGKMRTPVQLLSTEAVKDAEGFAMQQDKVLAEVRAYHEARHGSERWANRAAFSEAPICSASGPSPEWRFLLSCSCSAKAAGMTLPVWRMVKGRGDVCGDFSEKGGGGKWLRYR